MHSNAIFRWRSGRDKIAEMAAAVVFLGKHGGRIRRGSRLDGRAHSEAAFPSVDQRLGTVGTAVTGHSASEVPK